MVALLAITKTTTPMSEIVISTQVKDAMTAKMRWLLLNTSTVAS